MPYDKIKNKENKNTNVLKKKIRINFILNSQKLKEIYFIKFSFYGYIN